MFWISVFETAVFAVALLLFFTFPASMAFVFLHLLHVPRGVLGLVINRDLPKSHHLIREITDSLKGNSEETDETPLAFEIFRTRAT